MGFWPMRPGCDRAIQIRCWPPVNDAFRSEFTFRQALPADALCIGVLGMQVFLDTYATEGIRPSLAREVLDGLLPEVIEEVIDVPGSRFIVAETKGHMVAFAQLGLQANHELVPFSQAAELQRLYVQEPFTGRGLGTTLLQQAEASAASSGATALWLTAWVGNERALAFYRRRGYEQAGTTQFVLQDEQYENLLYVKALRANPAT